MIWLTRADGETFMLNDDQILYVEVPHETLLVLTTGERLRVRESAEEIADRIASWRRRIIGLPMDFETGLEADPDPGD